MFFTKPHSSFKYFPSFFHVYVITPSPYDVSVESSESSESSEGETSENTEEESEEDDLLPGDAANLGQEEEPEKTFDDVVANHVVILPCGMMTNVYTTDILAYYAPIILLCFQYFVLCIYSLTLWLNYLCKMVHCYGDSLTYFANEQQHVVVYKIQQGETISVESENILAFTQDCKYGVTSILTPLKHVGLARCLTD